MSRSKHVAIWISTLISLHGARSQSLSFPTAITNPNPFAFTVDSTSSASGARSEAVTETSTTTSEATSTAAAGDLATVSITAAAGYQVAQTCVQDCLYWDIYGYHANLDLAGLLGCENTVYNACYCTSIVGAQATSIISSCISQLCTGTAQIGDAISVYDAYCTAAGYPSATASTTTAGTPETTLVTQNVILTFTVGSSTFLVTEPGAVQTVISAPSSSTSTSGSATQKVNIGGIVGGIVGALVLIAALLAVVYIWLPRHRKRKAQSDSQSQGEQAQVGSTFTPRRGGGRAELYGKEKGIPIVSVVAGEVNEEREVEIDGTGTDIGKYGLRPEELDAEGRFVGELHGDGREVVPGELAGSEVR